MKRSLSVLFLTVVTIVIAVSEIHACSCSGRPPGVKGVQTCGYYSGAETVFIGLAEKIEIDKPNWRMKVTFSVERTIKGPSETSVEVFTSSSTASCGYPFKQGERYFVYGRKDKDGRYGESLCGPTTLLSDAEDDLEYVRDIEQGKRGTRIWGQVHEDWQPTLKDKRVGIGLPGVEVTIKSETDNFRTLTDANGKFLFKDFPEALYKITANLPTGYREIHARSDLTERYARGCESEYFRVTRQGSIRGRVIDFPWKQINNPWDGNTAQPKVTLIPLDDQDQPLKNVFFEEKWAYRDKFEYFFDTVPGGNYLLAMNPNNCPYPNNGIPTNYYPGVAAQSEAMIVSVKPGEKLVLSDFRSLPLLKERSITGVVLNEDGSPAVDAVVRLIGGVLGSGKCADGNVETKTDELGRFQFTGFETYEYQLQAYDEKSPERRTRYAKAIKVPLTGTFKDVELILDQ